MMPEPVLHPKTRENITEFVKNPSHAVVLTGYIGTADLLHWVSEQLVGTTLDTYPYYAEVRLLSDKKQIGIDQIRELAHLLSLKTPENRLRIVGIIDAHLMNEEAANALLKTLEEPPEHTVILLTATHKKYLLPTIQSRLQEIAVIGQSDEQELAKLPITDTVRTLLRATPFERLTLVDTLAKDKELLPQMLDIMMYMAHLALAKGGQGAGRWQQILRSAHDAEVALKNGGQTKLVLTKLMLSL